MNFRFVISLFFLLSISIKVNNTVKKQIDSMLDITNIGWDLERNIKNLKQIMDM